MRSKRRTKFSDDEEACYVSYKNETGNRFDS